MICNISGCRNLEWRCRDCGRVINKKLRAYEWHKISDDDYPQQNMCVLAVDMNQKARFYEELLYMGKLKGKHTWGSFRNKTATPTHWMQFPEAPK